ncbi:hypothetical protein, partial [Acetobacter tropicalis]|uniref:hypothetical protein n=1 Tax=Acetobacter tropicalis TaxID=104102 RepID=UPI001B8004E0
MAVSRSRQGVVGQISRLREKDQFLLQEPFRHPFLHRHQSESWLGNLVLHFFFDEKWRKTAKKQKSCKADVRNLSQGIICLLTVCL